MSRGYSAIGLVGPKTPANVGGVLRAAHCYRSSLVVSEGQRFSVSGGTNTPQAHRHIPYLRVDSIMNSIPYDCIPVVVEIEEGATPIQDFKHPERAFYILGPEDGSVPKSISSKCKYRVYVQTKDCMNLAATANVVLFHRALQRGEWS